MNIKSTNISESWSLTRNNWIIQLMQKFTVFAIVCTCMLIVFTLQKLPPAIPIWYSRPWGAEQLDNPWFIFTLPAGSLLFYGINVAMSKYLLSEYLIFAQVMYGTACIVSILSLFTVLKIILIVM